MCRLPPQSTRAPFAIAYLALSLHAYIANLLLAALHGAGIDQRTHLAVLLQSVAHFQLPHALHEAIRELIAHRILHQQPIRADARLSRVPELRRDRALHRVLQIAVLKHQKRRVPAQLQPQFLHRPRRFADQILPHRRRPRERQRADVRRLQQRLPDLLSVRGGAADHVEYARRHAGALCEEGQVQSGERRGAGRLEDAGAADGERGGQLARDHRDGEVPGGDEADDTDGLVEREELARGGGGVGGDRVAAEVLALLGEPADEIRAVLDFAAGFADWLATLKGHDLGELFAVLD